MSTLTDKLPKLPAAIDLDEAKKPAFAAVGVVDLGVEQVKDLPAEAKKLQAKLEAARVARTEQLKTVPAQLKTVPAQLKTIPAQVKGLRTEVETRVAKAQTEATAYYAKLATRGEKLVGQIRRQPATEAAIAEGKAAVKKAEAAATSAKKSVKATEKAAEGAAAKLG
jgi:DNA repair exonuclease SbcCD ATPase subunit